MSSRSSQRLVPTVVVPAHDKRIEAAAPACVAAALCSLISGDRVGGACGACTVACSRAVSAFSRRADLD